MTSRGQGLACWVLAMPPVSPAQPGAAAGGFSEPDSGVFGLALGLCSLHAGWLLSALVQPTLCPLCGGGWSWPTCPCRLTAGVACCSQSCLRSLVATCFSERVRPALGQNPGLARAIGGSVLPAFGGEGTGLVVHLLIQGPCSGLCSGSGTRAVWGLLSIGKASIKRRGMLLAGQGLGAPLLQPPPPLEIPDTQLPVDVQGCPSPHGSIFGRLRGACYWAPGVAQAGVKGKGTQCCDSKLMSGATCPQSLDSLSGWGGNSITLAVAGPQSCPGLWAGRPDGHLLDPSGEGRQLWALQKPPHVTFQPWGQRGWAGHVGRAGSILCRVSGCWEHSRPRDIVGKSLGSRKGADW